MSDWRTYLRDAAKRLGVPEEYALAIISGESNGNPGIIGPTNSNGTTDYGLFQLNSGGQGAGMSRAQMLDPQTNIDTGLPYLASAYKKGVAQGFTGYPLFKFVADHSGHASLDITHPGRTISLYANNVANVPTGFSSTTLPSDAPQSLAGPEALQVQQQAAAANDVEARKTGNNIVDGITGFATKTAAPFALALLLLVLGGLMIGLGSIHEQQ